MSFSQNILVATDAIVFGRDNKGEVHILLIKRKFPPFKDSWAFPGGFVDNDEDLPDAAKRELKEETGITVDDLKQFITVGTPGRDPRNHTVSVFYTAYVDKDVYQPKADDDAAEAKWHSLKKLPALAFDHNEVLLEAMKKLGISVRT